MSTDPKPTAPNAKTCNFNCTCNRDACSYAHYLTELKDRVKMKELWDEVYDKTEHNETDPDGVRKVVCNFGILCNKETCNFKHFCNYDGRSIIIRAWKKNNRSQDAASWVERNKDKITPDQLAEVVKLLGLSGKV